MIYGIGIDIAKNERIKNAVDRWGEKFLKRVFTDDELRYCLSRTNPYSSLSARFAAKEAFIKAVGDYVTFRDVEVILNKDGKPFLKLHRRAKEMASDRMIRNNHVSLSHEKDYSIAIVLLER